MRRLLLLALILLASQPVMAAPGYDIFIVGDRSHPRTRPIMQSLRSLFSQARTQAGKTVQDLPIDEYDSTSPEHQVAIHRLGLDKTILPCVGVAALDVHGHPDHVIAAVSPAIDEDAVNTLLVIAGRKIGVEPLIAVAAPPPTATRLGTWTTTFSDIDGHTTTMISDNAADGTFANYIVQGGARIPFQSGVILEKGDNSFTCRYTTGPMTGQTDTCVFRLWGPDAITIFSSRYQNALTWHRL